MLHRNLYYLFLLTAVVVVSIAVYIYTQIPKSECQQFAIQTQSFIHGRLDTAPTIDTVYMNGKYYWPQGPFPSILLIPFQLMFGSQFNQTYLQPILVVLLFIVLFKLALLKKFGDKNSAILAYSFIFASPVIGIVTEPCYSFFAHVISMVLLTATLLELESKQRPFILGLLVACIIATRPTASLILIAIVSLNLFKNSAISEKLKYITKLLIPIFISIFLLLLFNYVRFNNPFDNGYATNQVGDYLESLRSKGVFNLQYIPRNFYAYFLTLPVISTVITYNPVGTSFLIIAPFFLLSFKSIPTWNIKIFLYWMVIFFTLLILLSYYASGWVQFGPRFTTDFLPILFLLTLYGLKQNLKLYQLLIIIFSSSFNIYLLTSGFFLFKS